MNDENFIYDWFQQNRYADQRRILLPSLCSFHKVYVHIPYGVFVALDFLEVSNMGLYSKIRLFSECFKIAGVAGLIACAKYLCGALRLDHLDPKSSVFLGGVSDA